MKKMTIRVVLLAIVGLVAVGGCKSEGSSGQGQADSQQEADAKAIDVPKNIILALGDNINMRLVLIPAGKFLMGSPDDEKDRFGEEGPRREVTIAKPFYMGVTHVTVGQFAAFVKESGYTTEAEKAGWTMGVEIKDGKHSYKKIDGCSWRNPSFDQGDDHPVVLVSWNDANAFCGWLSKKSGKTVALPTESQWEYACRAGTKTAFPWGDNPDDGKGWANCLDQSLKRKLYNTPEAKCFNWDDGFVFTSPVGSFKANAFGLYDMNGNAKQWCQDWCGDHGLPATDHTETATAGYRILRGGSWNFYPGGCRSASRLTASQANHDVGFGFRVVVDVK